MDDVYIGKAKLAGKAKDFEWLKDGYRNAVCRYVINKVKKTLTLKRRDGNWRIIDESNE